MLIVLCPLAVNFFAGDIFINVDDLGDDDENAGNRSDGVHQTAGMPSRAENSRLAETASLKPPMVMTKIASSRIRPSMATSRAVWALPVNLSRTSVRDICSRVENA